MALTEINNPRLNVSGYDSDAASTTQLLYKYEESDLTDIDKYYLEVVIPELDNLTLYYIPDASGDIEFDIGLAVLGSLTDPYIEYHIVATPYRDGAGETGVTSIDILAVASTVPILSTYGANLYQYIAKPTNVAEFMTMFAEPKFWDGWDRIMYFISMAYVTVDFTFNALDINKAFLSTDTNASLGPIPRVSVMSLDYPVTANSQYLEIIGDVSATVVTEALILKLEPECKNPVMIQWLNSKGGYDYWLFQYEQTVTNIAEPGLKWETPITTDISTVRQTKQRAAFKSTQYITLKAVQLTEDEVSGLHDVKTSDDVRLWLNKDGSEYVNVVVSAGYDTLFTTGKYNYEFSLNIELPNNFDFLNAKLY